MRAIIQRVAQASVTVDGKVISSIGRGLCVLLGICRDDTPKDIEYMVRKILNLRVFEQNGERWKRSVKDEELEILCVSQFTLYAVLKGNKPDFHCAMGGEESEQLYQKFLHQMKSSYRPVAIKDGKFGAYMQVHIQNDGPVTIDIESPKQQQKQKDYKTGEACSKSVGKNSKDEHTSIVDTLAKEVDKL